LAGWRGASTRSLRYSQVISVGVRSIKDIDLIIDVEGRVRGSMIKERRRSKIPFENPILGCRRSII
jgi:hypothetical protein